ncbi:hypothetical protein D3C73_1569490 [compost metagenome]
MASQSRDVDPICAIRGPVQVNLQKGVRTDVLYSNIAADIARVDIVVVEQIAKINRVFTNHVVGDRVDIV